MENKKQIVVIHGGDSFKTYRDYIADLKKWEIAREKLEPRHRWKWKERLAETLGRRFEVLLPRMPNSNNARYQEWKIIFDKVAHIVKSNTILIGHSLGGVFLAKYLSENKFPKRIKAVILIAAPFDDSDDVKGGESMAYFMLPRSLAKLSRQAKSIYLLHSQDDPVVPFEHFKKYQRALPKAKTVVFKTKGHFNQEKFPKIVRIIKSI